MKNLAGADAPRSVAGAVATKVNPADSLAIVCIVAAPASGVTTKAATTVTSAESSSATSSAAR